MFRVSNWERHPFPVGLPGDRYLNSTHTLAISELKTLARKHGEYVFDRKLFEDRKNIHI